MACTDRRSWFVVALAAIAASSAYPQTEPQGAGKAASLEGTVIDAATGAPIPHATVGYLLQTGDQQRAPSGGSVSSDANGQFRIQNLPPKEYQLFANADGHLNRLFPGTIALAAGEKSSGFILRLVPTSAVSGRITDEDGNPLAGMEVLLWQITYRSGKKEFRAEPQWARTDDRGEYRLPGVAPGRYYLSAAPENEGPTAQTGDVRYVRRYYPGTPYPETAAAIDVRPGAETSGVSLKLSKVQTVHVSGKVLDDRPADVFLAPEGFVFNSTLTTKSASDGKFEFEGVLPGQYRLRARIKDSGREAWASRSISIGGDGLKELELLPVPAPSVTGQIHIEGGEEGVDLSKFWMELYQVSPGGIMFGTAVKKDGRFEEPNFPPGKYRVQSHAPPGFYLKEVRAGNQPLPDHVLDLYNGGPPQLDITISPKAASVTGRVYLADSEKTARRADVVLVPEDTDRKEDHFAYLIVASDADARFTIRDVPPGAYRAFALETVDRNSKAYMDPYFIGPLEGRGVRVSLGESDRADIKLTLIADR